MVFKIIMLGALVWLILGAINWCFCLFSKRGKAALSDKPIYEIIGLMIFTILLGPVPVIQAIFTVVKERRCK